MRDMTRDPGGRRDVTGELHAFGAAPTPAVIEVADLSPGQRARRGVMGLALCWGIAAVAVFLPILHLVLVPSFVVAGIAVAVALGRQTERVVGVRGPCPRCGSVEQFEAGGKLRRKRIVACPRCHTNLTLVVTEGQRARQMAVGRT